MPDAPVAPPAPQQQVIDPMVSVSLIPQTTPDYTFHKLLMFETVLVTQAKRVLETGTDVGDSARIFSTALRRTGGMLITVDKKTDLNYGWLQEYPNVMAVKGDSLSMQWKDVLDVLFLDSDHHKDHLMNELRKFGPWVRQGGVILVHDTCHSEFGNGITQAIRGWTQEVGLRWSEDPNPYGMAIIEMIRDLTPLRQP